MPHTGTKGVIAKHDRSGDTAVRTTADVPAARKDA